MPCLTYRYMHMEEVSHGGMSFLQVESSDRDFVHAFCVCEVTAKEKVMMLFSVWDAQVLLDAFLLQVKG